jgi:uncharacterized RDD family membrane protein YckC
LSQLVTGEAVELDLRVARLASRFPAAMIDAAIQFTILLVVILVVAGSGVSFDSAVAITLLMLLFVAVFLGYPVAFETLWRGRTPGKAAMGLRVVRDDGGPIAFRHALLRGLVGVFIDRWPSPFLFVGVIVCVASEQGKRLGDVAAGTIVVQERLPTRTPTTIPMPPQLASWAATLDLSALPGDLALAVREFLGRAAGLNPGAREQLGRQLGAAVASVVTPPPPPGTPGWAYLSAVLAERRRREEVRMREQSRPADAAAGWGGPPPAGTPSPWGSTAPVGTPSPWAASAPAYGVASPVGAPPIVPGPPEPVPASAPPPGPFSPPV